MLKITRNLRRWTAWAGFCAIKFKRRFQIMRKPARSKGILGATVNTLTSRGFPHRSRSFEKCCKSFANHNLLAQYLQKIASASWSCVWHSEQNRVEMALAERESSTVTIPASVFYEWQKVAKGAKQPFYFHLKDKEVFGFAGLYEQWLDRESGEQIETCIIITTEANKVLEPVHDRMPVILKSENYEQWLDAKEKDTEKLQKLLAPYPSAEMVSYKVSKSVNIPSNDSPELIEEIS